MDTKLLLRRHAIESILELFRIPINGVEEQLIQISRDSLEQSGINLDTFSSIFPIETEDQQLFLDTSKIDDPSALHDWLFDNMPHRVSWLNRKVPSHINVPDQLAMPRSKMYLDRMYAHAFIPAEKKTAVIDLHNSHGAYLASVDDNPLVIFDAASQIASLSDGYRSGSFISALDEGVLSENLASNPDMTMSQSLDQHPTQTKLLEEFGQFVCGECWDPIQHISFTRGGAEANEKAFQLCRKMGPGGKRIIAFEGSFHGRTTISMHSTHNPAKRKGFEIEGFETYYAPFPECKDPSHQPEVKDEWITHCTAGHLPELSGDKLLDAEIKSLQSIKTRIEKGDICCVIVEPMQCEGGDRYATNRFFNGLRALTRGLGVPLIFDEVQTGFGLGGSFFWHNDFRLRDAKGNPDGPECVTIAKRAQTGACLSTIKDEIPSAPHLINVQRGFIQAKAVQNTSSAQVCGWIRDRLNQLEKNYPDKVFDPRSKGYAFSFDMIDGESANNLLAKRFELGFMAYIAGSRTLRFRANMSTTEKELDFLFDGLRRGLGTKVSSRIENSLSRALPHKSGDPSDINYKIQTIDPADWPKYRKKILDIESESYEPERREKPEDLDRWVSLPDSLGLIAKDKESGDIIGFSIGCPIEAMEIDGCLQDPNRGKNNTFYSATLTVRNVAQGRGLGKALKIRQLDALSKIIDAHGRHRYAFCTGRQRIGHADKMLAINECLGAYPVETYSKQYGGEGEAIYYRIPLRRPHIEMEHTQESGLDAMHHAIETGIFTTAVGTKLTLSNWATPSMVRYMELLKSICPEPMSHAYCTSGQDELIDKSLRSLKVHRPKAKIAIGLTDQFFGNITAAATSLSDHKDPKLNWFNWPKLPHPNVVGIPECLQAIQQELNDHHPDEIFAFVVELKGEKSGFELDDSFLKPLKAILDEKDIPLIYSETASALGSSSQSIFKTEQLDTKPNMILWFTGGQLGHILVDDKYYVDKPLTLISTWDGDEISARRNTVRIEEWVLSSHSREAPGHSREGGNPA